MNNQQLNKFENLNQLNNYLSKMTAVLGDGIANDKEKTEQDIIRIAKSVLDVLQKNQHLLEGQNCSSEEVLCCLRSMKKLSSIINTGETSALIGKVCAVASTFFTNLSQDSVTESMETMESLKSIDHKLYYQTLGLWVSKNQVPIKELNISEEEMIKLAPWLTYLDLSDGTFDHYLDDLTDASFSDDFDGNFDDLTNDLTDASFSDDFVGKLLENTKNLEFLLIEKSKIDGSCLSRLKNTQHLQEITIESCPYFNGKLPKELPNLKNLDIQNCNVFNQELNLESPMLEKLKIGLCDAFNGALPKELPNLTSLIIDDCEEFNQPLPEMPKLENLHLENCDAFIKELPKELPNLTSLIIDECEKFNQALPRDLSKLQNLEILSCRKFNQDLRGELPCLKSLIIKDCQAFNQALPLVDVSKLQNLKIKKCPAFKIFDHQLHTVVLAFHFLSSMQLLQQQWEKLPSEEATEIRKKFLQSNSVVTYPKDFFKLRAFLKFLEIDEQVFLKYFPQYKIPVELSLMEDLIKVGDSEEQVISQFGLMKKSPHFVEYLQRAVESFPVFTTYLVRNYRRVVEYVLATKPFQTLSEESKLALLPLLSPDKIQEMLMKIPEEEKRKWLDAHFEYDEQDATELDHQLEKMQKLLKKVPLKALAAFASLEDSKVILAYKFAMDDTQLSVVIPELHENDLLNYLKKQSVPAQKEILSFATTAQKRAYIKEDLQQFFPALQDWKTVSKELNELIKAFHENSTNEKLKEIDALWIKIFSSTHIAIQQFNSFLMALKKVLLKHCPSEEFREVIVKYLNQQQMNIDHIKKEFESKKFEITELSKKLKKGIEIPDAFIDQISFLPMRDPYTDENGHRADKSSWDNCKNNPFNREPINIHPDKVLKEKIDLFFKEHPELQLEEWKDQ